MQENECVNVILPLILRLANNENNFTARVSAVHLIISVYQKAGKLKE